VKRFLFHPKDVAIFWCFVWGVGGHLETPFLPCFTPLRPKSFFLTFFYLLPILPPSPLPSPFRLPFLCPAPPPPHFSPSLFPLLPFFPHFLISLAPLILLPFPFPFNPQPRLSPLSSLPSPPFIPAFILLPSYFFLSSLPSSPSLPLPTFSSPFAFHALFFFSTTLFLFLLPPIPLFTFRPPPPSTAIYITLHPALSLLLPRNSLILLPFCPSASPPFPCRLALPSLPRSPPFFVYLLPPFSSLLLYFSPLLPFLPYKFPAFFCPSLPLNPELSPLSLIFRPYAPLPRPLLPLCPLMPALPLLPPLCTVNPLPPLIYAKLPPSPPHLWWLLPPITLWILDRYSQTIVVWLDYDYYWSLVAPLLSNNCMVLGGIIIQKFFGVCC
jgi:hypothetical protein